MPKRTKTRSSFPSPSMRKRSGRIWRRFKALRSRRTRSSSPRRMTSSITIGSQWKQRYIVEKEGKLYIAPVQYFTKTDTWANYNEANGINTPGSTPAAAATPPA